MHHILIVEDSSTQAERLRFILDAEGFEVEVAEDGQQGLDRVLSADFDLVISDVLMPIMSGYELCRLIKAHPQKRRVPVLLLTTLCDPLDILQGVECGADNYLTKPYKDDALIGRVRYVLANQAQRSEGRLKVGVEVTFLGKTLTVTPDKEQILDLLLATCEDVVRANQELRTSQAELAQAKAEVERHNTELVRLHQELEGRVQTRTGELIEANSALRKEVVERQQVEAALDREQELLKAVLENVQDGIIACDAAGELIFVNRAAREFHVQAERHLPANEWSRHHDLYHPDGKSPLRTEETPLFRALNGETVRDVEMVIAPHGGAALTILASGQAFRSPGGETLGAVTALRDITDRQRLEQQLRQSQKMDAVGRLAAGVAHDFNNLLTVINGYADMMHGALRPGDPSGPMLGEILKAGERAVGLTRQLLAFSRQQVISPKVLNLNAVVAGVGAMLRRLIGEDVDLTCTTAPALWRVKADPSQVEQVLVNLAVNARDAMPGGGRLTIETANVELDEGYSRLQSEVRSGQYVLLAVKDTGCGMDEATRGRIFEPFFTTKEVGKGTGLGLATVYGIVKQAGGHVALYSETGRGTTFKIYLPRVEDALSVGSECGLSRRPTGTETVLLVEDDDAVRALALNILRAVGYTVLEAHDGNEALGASERHKGPIHLLLTDVVMPGMGGRVLAGRLTGSHPGLKVLFMSGYADDAVVRHGVLEAEVAFLQKPFAVDGLVRKVRAALDHESLPGGEAANSRQVAASEVELQRAK